MLIRIRSVKAVTGELSSASIYAKIRQGLFPKAVHIGPRSVGWPEYEVKAICAARIAGSSIDEIRALVDRLHSNRTQLLEVTLSNISGGTL